MSFGDGNHGAVTLFDEAQPSSSSAWLTSDGGHTWRRFDALGRVPVSLAFDGPRHAVASALAPGGGVLVSDDGGRKWRRLTVPEPAVGSIDRPTFVDADHGWWLRSPGGQGLVNPTQPVALWRTSDGGHMWQHLPALGIPNAGTRGPLRFTDPEHGVLVVVTRPQGVPSLLTTADGGGTWVAAATFDDPVPETYLWGVSLFVYGRHVVAEPLWVAGADVVAGSVIIQQGANVALHAFVSVSDDAGQSWGPLRAAPTISGVDIAVAPTLDDRGRLVLLDSRRLWDSEDGGATWHAREAVLPEGLQSIGTIAAAPGALFVFTGAGGRTSNRQLLRSRDGGIHWSAIPLPRPST